MWSNNFHKWVMHVNIHIINQICPFRYPPHWKWVRVRGNSGAGEVCVFKKKGRRRRRRGVRMMDYTTIFSSSLLSLIPSVLLLHSPNQNLSSTFTHFTFPGKTIPYREIIFFPHGKFLDLNLFFFIPPSFTVIRTDNSSLIFFKKGDMEMTCAENEFLTMSEKVFLFSIRR